MLTIAADNNLRSAHGGSYFRWLSEYVPIFYNRQGTHIRFDISVFLS